MGRSAAGLIAEGLIALGRDPRTPALAVENAGSDKARLWRAPLERLGETLEAAGPTGPVLLVIGEVAAKAAGQGQAPQIFSAARMAARQPARMTAVRGA
jgi:uroporphyrin-III C-methyltransferase